MPHIQGIAVCNVVDDVPDCIARGLPGELTPLEGKGASLT